VRIDDVPDGEGFDAIVSEALVGLPDWVRDRMENVAVLVADWPTREQRRSLRDRPGGGEGLILGLYEGVPLTHRGGGYHLVAPDRITLFRLPLAAQARDLEDLRRCVQQTVLHEIAHHFGFSEKEIRGLGY
jgi:predicted Zn-dependent protease with MMP-like domain